MPSEKDRAKKNLVQRLALKSCLAKETLSEFLGTFIMIVLGCGSIAQAVLSREKAGGIITINIGFATAVVMALYATFGVSGMQQNSLSQLLTVLMCWQCWSLYMFSLLELNNVARICIDLLFVDGKVEIPTHG